MPDPQPIDFDDPTTMPRSPESLSPPAYGLDGNPVVSYAADDPANPECLSSEKIPIIAGGTVLSALVAGFLYHCVAQFYDSFTYVPLGAGLVAGLLLVIAFRQAKLTALVPIIVCGVVAGLLTYLVRFEFTALADRPYLVQKQTAKRAAAHPDRDESAIRAEVEREITPLNVVPVYVDSVAEEGVLVKSRRYSSSEVVRGNDFKTRLVLACLGCVFGSFSILQGILRPKKSAE